MFFKPILKVLKKMSSWRLTLLAAFGTSSYVSYTDQMRYARMVKIYKHGNLVCPFHDSTKENEYFPRPELEKQLRSMLQARNAGEYYFVRGEVGSGKSRSLVKVVRELMKTDGAKAKGTCIFMR